MTRKLILILTAILLAGCYDSTNKIFQPGPTTTTTTCPKGMDLGADMRCHY